MDLKVKIENVEELKKLIEQLNKTVNQINKWKPRISIVKQPNQQ